MDIRERVADFVRRFPGRDDDEISAALRIRPRQTINQACRALERAGLIERKPGMNGKIANFPKRSLPAASLPTHNQHMGRQSQHELPKATNAKGGSPDKQSNFATLPTDWFWEGNVTEAVCEFLIEAGWLILSKADTGRKERGLDILAEQAGRQLMVEVKGYPSLSYRDPRRAGEQKPTSPTNQAQRWFSHALLKAVRLRSAYKSALVAIALPDFPRYRSLYKETRPALDMLAILILFVGEEGSVEAIGL